MILSITKEAFPCKSLWQRIRAPEVRAVSQQDDSTGTVDRSVGGVKIGFAILSLWPPCAFLFLDDEDSDKQSREAECHAAFWSSVIPLAFGLIIAILSVCWFCKVHPQHVLRRLLFYSDVVLSIATFASGVVILVLMDDWSAACDDRDSKYACSLRAVGLRVLVDVFGMAVIHICTAAWMYHGEHVLDTVK
mmetsp:Transcript_108147/g.187754  ORF Transcript_108147/g.187754 Transcript_108147/m.187754 type:complete len:191 (+) Transcript_108147:48-620(+)